jgi:DNA-binding response OmpR family regulator
MILPFPKPAQANTPSLPRILLVEDDDAVRELVASILQHAGYPCTSVADSRAALALSDIELAGVELLVTDVLVPGLDGPALSHRLRERHPDLEVLLISAWLRPGELRVPADQLLPKPRTSLARMPTGLAPDASGMSLLAKPFGFDELVARVKSALKH